MKGLAVAIVMAGLAMAVGLYAGLHEIAREFHRGIGLSGDVTLDSGPTGISINVSQ